MLWKVTLALSVVCAVGLCDGLRGGVTSRLVMPQHYGVKLCGREFIRAVIFTCGGSRWRRSAEGPLHWISNSDLTSQDDRPAESADTAPPHLGGHPSLADLISLRSILENLPEQLTDQNPPAQKPLSEARGTPGADEWPVKRKRNFSLGVAGVCCSQGCTKNDIGRLC